MTALGDRRARHLWRRAHEAMAAAPGWHHISEEWALRGTLGDRGASIRATLRVRSWLPPATFSAAVEVTGPVSRTGSAVVRRVKDELAHRGYTQWPVRITGQPVLASLSLKSTELADERACLARLLGVADAARRTEPKDVASFAASFDEGRGPWRPDRASWERRRPITIAGRACEVILMVQLYQGGRLGHPRMTLATSVAIWPPWNGTAAYPEWLSDQRRRLARQFRAIRHKAEWIRGPKNRGVGIMSLTDHPSSTPIASLRRKLDGAAFGDP